MIAKSVAASSLSGFTMTSLRKKFVGTVCAVGQHKKNLRSPLN